MFGYFKLDKECPYNIFIYYKKYYCLLCKALNKHYGFTARFTLSYDVAFLFALIFEDEKIDGIQKIHCIKTDEKVNEILIDKTAEAIATVNVLLSAAKLEDDILDENKFSAKVIHYILNSSIKKAKNNHSSMWKIISEEYSNLRVLESKNGCLETLEKCFSSMMLRLAKECFGVEDSETLNKLEVASKWLYFIDAVDDIDENIADDVFNPLKNFGSFENLKQNNYDYIIKHFYSIFSKISLTQAPKNMRSLMIDRVIFWGIPESTVRTLTKSGR